MQERIPPLETAAESLTIAEQDKDKLPAAHISNKMRTEKLKSKPPRLPRLCDWTLNNLVVLEEDKTRHLSSVSICKALGPDGIGPFMLKHCVSELKNHSHASSRITTIQALGPLHGRSCYTSAQKEKKF